MQEMSLAEIHPAKRSFGEQRIFFFGYTARGEDNLTRMGLTVILRDRRGNFDNGSEKLFAEINNDLFFFCRNQ
ncbi:MAG: hypothetical protein LBB90_09640 [Tannerella sp.]|nr:hypothetical protein [Tannerella sp.]